MTGKRCTGCGETLPATVEFFHRHKPSPDGLKPRCKSCQCSSQAQRYIAKPEDVRRAILSNVLAWRRSNPGKVAATARRWERANREKKRAHVILNRAVRRGAVTKQPCEQCGSGSVQAHHDDYSQPLAVRWLCAAHHAAEHIRQRREIAS